MKKPLQEPSPILGDMNAETFMSTFWQKRPCLFKQVLSERVASFPDENELAGFALEEEVESRLILGSPGISQPSELTLSHGPFNSETLTSLPETNWTLLLQSMDLWEPGFADCLNWVNFIPRWRLDDIMISIAAPGGGVGPHRDQYDVFLIQTRGKKRWQVAPPSDIDDFEAIADLLLVDNFQAEFDEILSAGDVLYLPPGWLHWGIAQTLTVTCSIGFRSPDIDVLLQQLIEEISTNHSFNLRYSDPWRKASSQMGITAADINEFKQMLNTISDNETLLSDVLARQVTQTGVIEHSASENRQLPMKTIEDLQEGIRIQLIPSSRMTYYINSSAELRVYINGERIDLASALIKAKMKSITQFLDQLAGHHQLPYKPIIKQTTPELLQFLLENDLLYID